MDKSKHKVKIMKRKHKAKIIVVLIPALATIVVTILTSSSNRPEQNIQANNAGNGNIVNSNINNTVNNTVNNTYNTVNNGDNKDEFKESAHANDIIKSLYLGMTKYYVDELIGTPKYELLDEDLINAFYSLDDENVIIRCIFEEGDLLVGYIVTVREIDKGIKFPDPMYKDEMLEYGNVTIETVGYKGISDDLIEGNLGNDIAYDYYWECHYLSHIGNFNGFIVAILPYGFWEDDSYYIMELVGFSEAELNNMFGEDVDIDKEISKCKEILHPNTFGIINPDYCDRIHPYIKNIDMMTYWSACVNDFMEN